MRWSRRSFVRTAACASAGLSIAQLDAAERTRTFSDAELAQLPTGNAPRALAFTHFPSRVHAFVWRNWQLVPASRMARVIDAQEKDILALGRSMGLGRPPRITADQQRRSYISVIKRNWPLLPYSQLLTLLHWTPEHLAFVLREDDFLFIKLGSAKPQCEPLRFAAADEATRAREREIAAFIREQFPDGVLHEAEPLFRFVDDLSQSSWASTKRLHAKDEPLRFCYSYFALYGDPLLERDADPYSDGYLARLAGSGVNGVWLQAVLHKLAPCPLDSRRSAQFEERLENLRKLVRRADRHGIRVFLYLNEPRALPHSFFANDRASLKGVVEGDYATLCTSTREVQSFLTNSVAHICRAVPQLGGFFTITASENLTNCWSHGGGKACPRCGSRSPDEVIAEVNAAIHNGIREVAGSQQLIAWDWGWNDSWAADAIKRLPIGVSLMSVSEWSLPIERGGTKTSVGEYSISSVGPGPRAKRHWKLARERGLKTIAKIQAGNSWELSSVPYIPALSLVAEHARKLREANVDGLMLGWTLGGYPSPNIQAVGEILSGGELATVARRWFGPQLAPAILKAWNKCGDAFREFPFHAGVVYSAPLQNGPSNLLWPEPTRQHASMVGFPHDDLDAWRSVYEPAIFIQQLEKVARGFQSAARDLRADIPNAPRPLRSAELLHAESEARLIDAAALHWESVASQSRFILARRSLATVKSEVERASQLSELEHLLAREFDAAHELLDLQKRDSRLGFEASNHYYYITMDLAEKMLNCRQLAREWLSAQRTKRAHAAEEAVAA